LYVGLPGDGMSAATEKWATSARPAGSSAIRLPQNCGDTEGEECRGRALQAESDDLEVIGLALLYPALERNVMFLAMMDIRARSISFTTRPRRP